MQQSHTLSAFLYAVSNGIERASYYGIRSILFLYMVGESLQMTTGEAVVFYGWLTVSFYFSKVIGALLGDLLIGNKMAILIGGLLQAFGCFLLCFQTMSFLYISVLFLVIGNGLFSPNVLAQFGKQYSNKPKLVDSGFTGLFFFINAGAFFGVMVFGLLSDKNLNYGFIFGGLLMIVATLLAFFNTDEKLVHKESTTDSDIILKIVFVLIAIIISGIFWGSYEISAGLSSLYISQTGFDQSIWYMLPGIFGIIFTLIFAFIWTFVYTNQFAKFCVGLIISAIAIGMLLSFPENPAEGSSIVLIISTLFLALGETFVAPLLFAITTRYANPKYLAILLSLVSLPILMFNKIAGVINELTYDFNPTGIFIAVTSILVFLGIIAFVMWFVQRKDDEKVFTENEIIE